MARAGAQAAAEDAARLSKRKPRACRGFQGITSKGTSRDQGALDSLGHLCERLPAGVRDPHAHNASLSTVGNHALALRGCESGLDQFDHHVDREPVRTQDRLGVTVTAPGKQFEGAAAVRIGTAIVASGRHRCTVTIIAPTRRGSLAGGSRLATTPPPQRAPWPTDQRRTCRLGSMLAEAHRQKKAPGVPGHPVVSNKGETLEGGQRPHPPNVIASEPFRGLHLCHRNPQRPYSLVSRSVSACSNAQL